MYLHLQLIINKVQIEIPPDLLQEEENDMVRLTLSSLQLLVYQLPSYMFSWRIYICTCSPAAACVPAASEIRNLIFLFYNQHMFWDLFMFLVSATIILVLLAHLYLYLEHLNNSSATVLDKSLNLCAFYNAMYILSLF